MNKYVFEKYEFNERGRIFLGYITVKGEDASDALKTAQDKVGESIRLHQIFVPQNV